MLYLFQCVLTNKGNVLMSCQRKSFQILILNLMSECNLKNNKTLLAVIKSASNRSYFYCIRNNCINEAWSSMSEFYCISFLEEKSWVSSCFVSLKTSVHSCTLLVCYWQTYQRLRKTDLLLCCNLSSITLYLCSWPHLWVVFCSWSRFFL